MLRNATLKYMKFTCVVWVILQFIIENYTELNKIEVFPILKKTIFLSGNEMNAREEIGYF